ncbi:hypothetical protein, partial [uncultured Nostoc sp.]|uniref:hypothetical protein n=1 Tax=uncultured Nostoc sp. TaxID=340711 RepID=UPI0035CA8D90
ILSLANPDVFFSLVRNPGLSAWLTALSPLGVEISTLNSLRFYPKLYKQFQLGNSLFGNY